MAEFVTLRALRLQNKREEKLEEIRKATPSYIERMTGGEQEAGAPTAQVVLALEGSSQSPALKGAGAKRSSAETKGKGVSEPPSKRHRPLASSAKELSKANTPIAWFCNILRDGDSFPDYTKFEHRDRVESSWNMMAKFCAENNHAIFGYEASLKAARDENAELREQASKAKDDLESSRSSLKLKQRQVKTLESHLTEKDKVIASLRGELEAVKEAQASIEERVREEAFDKVYKRFRTISKKLHALKDGPMLAVNLGCQAKVNLELIEAMQDESFDIDEERAASEADLRKYSGAPEDFDMAFDKILKLLLVKMEDVGEGESSSQKSEVEPSRGDGEEPLRGEEELPRGEEELSSGDLPIDPSSSEVAIADEKIAAPAEETLLPEGAGAKDGEPKELAAASD